MYPFSLKRKKEKCLSINKTLRKDVRKFIVKLTAEAGNCQVYSTKKQHRQDPLKEDDSAAPPTGCSPHAKKLPLCLWKLHADKSLRPLLSRCLEYPKEEKTNY